jgi:hypothetical protein
MEYIVVDKIEGTIAVCEREDMTMLYVPLAKLPEGVTEGSVLLYDGISFTRAMHEEENRRTRITEKMDSLFED